MSSQACYPAKAPKVDELLDTLSHHLRREIVLHFETRTDEGTAAVDDVVAHIDQRVPAETTESPHRELRHTHPPKLAERGWLDYDTHGERIRYHGHDRATRWLKEVHAVF